MGANNSDFQAGHGQYPITYIPHTNRDGDPMHAFQMRDDLGNLLGHLNLDKTGVIEQIETHPEVRRQGIATALYNYAKDASSKDPSIPAPRQSGARTQLGDRWAKSITKAEGVPLKPLGGGRVVPKDTYTMRGAMWEMMLPLKKDNK
jgi:GNAT superfamily N-acetyltransferase